MDEEIRWIVERKPRDIDYIKERYEKEDGDIDDLSVAREILQGSLPVGLDWRRIGRCFFFSL
ncbi:hypothetical protein HFP66_01780 [Bacillus sp. A17A.1]